jgi:hypothetical protein
MPITWLPMGQPCGSGRRLHLSLSAALKTETGPCPVQQLQVVDVGCGIGKLGSFVQQTLLMFLSCCAGCKIALTSSRCVSSVYQAPALFNMLMLS